MELHNLAALPVFVHYFISAELKCARTKQLIAQEEYRWEPAFYQLFAQIFNKNKKLLRQGPSFGKIDDFSDRIRKLTCTP